MTENGPIQLSGSVYDYPRYYDLVYGSDWKAELTFLNQVFCKFCPPKPNSAGMTSVQRVFEPACGTGRLLFRLARCGYAVSGLDLNPHAVTYCNKRLQRHGFSPSTNVGDMANFRLSSKVDAAFNMINSFRHLQSEDEAQGHFACMSKAVRKGGLYVLGVHLTPSQGRPCDSEKWSARRGHLGVTTRLWNLERNLRQRYERCAMTYDIYTPRRRYRLQDEVRFRTYTAEQFQRLIDSTGGWQVLQTFDFAYDLNRPIEVGPASEDVVFALRRR